jgi:prepilin-type N-terminal cleavage/methylation domain-containing protein
MKRKLSWKKPGLIDNTAGFTLIEVMIAMFVSAVVLASVAVTYNHLQDSSIQQVQVGLIQQNLRGALAVLEKEFRIAGQDFNQTHDFGVTDVRRFTITAPGTAAGPDLNGSQILRMTLDLDEDGQLGDGETVTYSLYDKDGDGVPFDLARSISNPGDSPDQVSGRQLLAEGIEAIEYAYAYDYDDDGLIDTWTVDISRPSAIKAIQIWILARANRPDRKYVNTHQYTMNGNTIGPFDDHFRRWLLTEIISCRNL